ncbi:MFS transporter [Acidianus brierleyi]|uniref:MFS transporter n=1 Tax=Acidianus brierleyi TaxID=41673 RepID=A0A2U9ICZ8_9CREN|nr:MFS transporter [Acidianus brierleyi]AWR93844.1 MFS transporter [Acidianus brierleyi]
MSKTNWKNALYNIMSINLINFNITLAIFTMEWIISKLTCSSLLTGILIGLSSLAYFFSYFTGAFMDLTRKKKTILLGLIIPLFTILFLSQIALLANNDIFTIILLFYTFAILTGFTSDIASIILSIWIKENVNEKDYRKVSSINRVTLRSLRILAEALAGIFLAISFKYSITPSLIILVVVGFLLLPMNITENVEEKRMHSFKKSLIDGFYYVRRSKVLTQFTILTTDNLFFEMQGLLLLFYVEDVLHQGPIYFSALLISAEIGIVVGSIFALRINKGKLGFYQIIFRLIISASLASYILINNIFLALIPTFLILFSSGVNSTLTSATLLRYIDKEYWGRTTGFIGVIANGLSTLSGPLGGILIEIIGVGWTYVLVSVVMLIFTFLKYTFKEYYNLEIK